MKKRKMLTVCCLGIAIPLQSIALDVTLDIQRDKLPQEYTANVSWHCPNKAPSVPEPFTGTLEAPEDGCSAELVVKLQNEETEKVTIQKVIEYLQILSGVRE